jgi:hypothetical protein
MTGPLPEDVLEAKKGALMHTVPHHAMPATRRVRKQWVSALLWLLFCAAMVVIGLFLTPEFGAVDAPDGVPLLHTVAVHDDAVDAAVPMAAVVLLPYEQPGTPVAWAKNHVN